MEIAEQLAKIIIMNLLVEQEGAVQTEEVNRTELHPLKEITLFPELMVMFLEEEPGEVPEVTMPIVAVVQLEVVVLALMLRLR